MRAYKIRQNILGIVALASITATGCATSTRTTTTSQAQVITLREAYNNVHVVKGKGGYFLVDAGLEKSAATIDARLRSLGLSPARMKGILITHGHADHAGGAMYFRNRYKTKIIAGSGDREMLARGTNDKLCPTDKMGRDRLKESQKAHYTPYEADRWIKKKTDLSALLGMPVEVVPIPGHTAGSLAIIVGDAAFVGDLFRGGILASSAETHFYMCDLQDNRNDIKWLLRSYPKVKRFFPGHFGPVTRAAVSSYLAKVDKR